MSASQAHALGQLLFIELEISGWNKSIQRMLSRHRPGGVLFLSFRAPEALPDLLSKVFRAAAPRPFLALEEEGGTLDPLRACLPSLPSPCLAAQKGPAAVERLGDLIGEGLALLGFNTNLAPVLDLFDPLSEAVPRSRAFGSDPEGVTRCGRAFVAGLSHHKIVACGKHFPGLGAAQFDRQAGLPLVAKPMSDLWREDLLPYRALADRLALVKVSASAYKAYDYEVLRPAALSSGVVEGLLRAKLGYQGLAVADVLELAADAKNLSPEEAAVRAVNAGCDMLLVGRNEKTFVRVKEALGRAVETDKIPPRRLEQALERIRQVKKGIARPKVYFSPRKLMRLNREVAEFAAACKGEEQKIA